MQILVLQHVACEPPAVFEDVLLESGAKIIRVELDEGEAVPDGEFDAIVAMGGPMSVNDHDEHPWLLHELALIRDWVESGRPYWGSCLGAQLLAAALGSRVYAGPAPEVGVLPIELTADAQTDPLFAGLPPTLPTLQWHGDTFDLPEDAVLLASSPAYVNQAFRYKAAYGVQFHIEVTPALAREWAEIPAYAEYADRVLGPGAVAGLMADFDASCAEMQRHARALFEGFVALVERSHVPRA